MDCKTARLLLPRDPRDLGPADRAGLEVHLASCADCTALAGPERAYDRKLAAAMKQVPVPAGLRDRILNRLAQERDARLRRRVRLAWGSAAAAALLLLSWGAWALYYPARVRLDLEELRSQTSYLRPSPQEVHDAWERLGVKADAPRFVNYGFHTGHGLAELPGLQGKKLAVVDFARDDAGDQKNARHPRARIYVLPAHQFDVNSLAAPAFERGYKYNLDVRYNPGDAQFAFLVFYTGPNFDWLIVDPAESVEKES